MKAQIEIDMDYAAFYPDPGPELARILRKLAKEIDGQRERMLRDINGNSVGWFTIEE